MPKRNDREGCQKFGSGVSVLRSLCYLLLRRVLPLALWRWRSTDVKELENAVLRHELAILHRQTRRPVMTAVDRLFFSGGAGSCRERAGHPSW